MSTNVASGGPLSRFSLSAWHGEAWNVAREKPADWRWSDRVISSRSPLLCLARPKGMPFHYVALPCRRRDRASSLHRLWAYRHLNRRLADSDCRAYRVARRVDNRHRICKDTRSEEHTSELQ